jgi:MYXO-CTERM domain-containing protein
VLIANNTVLDNATTTLKWDAGPHPNTRVVGNIFAGHSPTQPLLLQANSTRGVAFDHYLWSLDGVAEPFLWGSTIYDHSGWVTATSQGRGDVLGDPQLAGTWKLPVANLKLSPTSPALDQGAGLAQATTDFAGAARPAGDGVDIGAFELGAAAPDGGVPLAGPNRDAAAPGSKAGKGGGCSCHVGGKGAPPTALGFALFALDLLRRRGQRH